MHYNNITENTIAAVYVEGAGIQVYKASAEIIGNTISYNSGISEAQAFGGGLAIYYNVAEVKVLDNEISYNELVSNGLPVGGGITSEHAYEYLLIENNYIHHNSCSGEGGHAAGILINDNRCVVDIINNDISYNEGYGTTSSTGPIMRLISLKQPVHILNNEFANNTVTQSTYCYGGIFTWDALDVEVVVDGNRFIDNHSDKYCGAFYARNSNNISLTNNIFTRNSALSCGAILFFQHDGIEEEDVFLKYGITEGSDDMDFQATSIRSEPTRTYLANNTFIENHANYNGGAIFLDSYDSLMPLLFNNVFWENTAGSSGKDIYSNVPDSIFLFYSDIDVEGLQTHWTGKGNFYADPGFIDDECHIDSTSSCLDTGIDSLMMEGVLYCAPEVDFEGTPRPCHMGVDVGADECEIFTGLSDRSGIAKSSTFNLQTYPNPTRGNTDFGFRISDFGRVTLKIHDLHGREVAVVLDEKLPAGEHVVRFDASGLPAGIYLIQLRAEGIARRANCKLVVGR